MTVVVSRLGKTNYGPLLLYHTLRGARLWISSTRICWYRCLPHMQLAPLTPRPMYSNKTINKNKVRSDGIAMAQGISFPMYYVPVSPEVIAPGCVTLLMSRIIHGEWIRCGHRLGQSRKCRRSELGQIIRYAHRASEWLSSSCVKLNWTEIHDTHLNSCTESNWTDHELLTRICCFGVNAFMHLTSQCVQVAHFAIIVSCSYTCSWHFDCAVLLMTYCSGCTTCRLCNAMMLLLWSVL